MHRCSIHASPYSGDKPGELKAHGATIVLKRESGSGLYSAIAEERLFVGQQQWMLMISANSTAKSLWDISDVQTSIELNGLGCALWHQE